VKFPVSNFITDSSSKLKIFLKVMEIQASQKECIHLFQEIERTSLAAVRVIWETLNPSSIAEGIAEVLKNAPSLLSLQHIEILRACSDSIPDKPLPGSSQKPALVYDVLSGNNPTALNALNAMTKYGNDLLNSPKYFSDSSPRERIFCGELELWLFIFQVGAGFITPELPVKAVAGVSREAL